MENNISPLISVVLPVFNVEEYIKESIESVLNQTIQDFEIIVIDDCSTDATLQIVSQFDDQRIRVITKQKNKGLIDSLNIGFDVALGKYIARVDGDDVNTLDRFEKQLNYLEANKEIAACGCWLKAFGYRNDIIKHKENHKDIQAHLLNSNPMSLGATMLRTASYIPFRFDTNMWHVEDYDYWARTAWDCKLHNLQEVLYYYRTHKTQVSTQFKKIQLKNDVSIKLNLWKKLKYNQNLYEDEFIIKMLFTNHEFEIKDYQLLQNWFGEIRLNNIKLEVFDNSELKKILRVLNRKIIFDIFFTNRREWVTKKIRKELFKELSFIDSCYVIKKKISEKKKYILNKL